jgi:hypothetical protein
LGIWRAPSGPENPNSRARLKVAFPSFLGESVAPQKIALEQAAETLVGAVILRSPALRDDEESRMFMKMRGARFFASLRMTAGKRFPAACEGVT